jgi:hypothetical protein
VAGKSPVRLEVEGLDDLLRVARRVHSKEINAAVRKANVDAAAIARDDARAHAPRKSGRLAASVTAVRSLKYGAVKAGTAARVPYAAPIHWGWPARNIAPREFLLVAVVKKREQIESTYLEGLEKVARLLESRGR